MELALIHDAVKGRARFRAVRLRNSEVSAALLSALGRERDILGAALNSLTGSLLVRFSPSLETADVARIIERCLEGRACDAAPASVSAAAAHGGAATRPWHATSGQECCSTLGVAEAIGLDANEADLRRARFGPNALDRREPRGALEIFAEQLLSLPMILLGGSTLISIATGGIIDAIAIGVVVVANALIATTTERQAERTILSISNYDHAPIAVLRAGTWVRLPPENVVPGDVILLEPGTLVPADARLVMAEDLTVNEAALTGESLPVHKNAALVLREDTPIADRINMVFRGTAVTGGRGVAVIAATGPSTEIGLVQSLLTSVRPPPTPIQRQLGEVERELVIINGAICAVVFGVGLLRGHPLLAMLRSVISLAVASIPEGLPAIATTTLALGVQEMRKRDVLVRKLDAVEALGAAEIMALDKTGTLTETEMSCVKVHAAERFIAVDGLDPSAEDRREDLAIVRDVLACAALSSQVNIAWKEGALLLEGTPTETALVRSAYDVGLDIAAHVSGYDLAALVPRGEGRKRVSSLCRSRSGGADILSVKGDPAEVLARSRYYLGTNGPEPLTEAVRAAVLVANQRMAGEALRVLGVAFREGGDPSNEADLIWLGLAGIANPIRAAVPRCLEALHGAGIRTVMITGDQSATAYAIARQLDLGDGHEIRVLEAGQTRNADKEVLAALAAQPHVFARVSPSDKLEIVRALQNGGRVVAMTGDGINDGPALRAADIGIAMGAGGTDVAREVADIVLATDDLGGIVEGVRLGRATYANMRKVLRFLVGTNASESLVMLGASIAGWAEPMNPLQLLWLNLVTDVAPALALALEAPEDDILTLAPLDPKAPLFSTSDFRRVIAEGAVLGSVSLAVSALFGGAGRNSNVAGTIVFHGLTCAQLIHAWSCRTAKGGLLRAPDTGRNGRLDSAVLGGLFLQGVVQVLPLSRRVLGLAPLGISGFAGIAGIALASTAINELVDFALERRSGAVLVRSAKKDVNG